MHSSTSARRTGKGSRFGCIPARVLAMGFEEISVASVQVSVLLNPHDLLIV
jgi:hypothetical protein